MFLLIYIYITDLACYTNFHWFFNHECQHIFGKQIFQSPKNDKNMNDKNTNNYTSLNQYHNTYFYQIKCRFYPQTGCMNKQKITTKNSSHIPDRFSKLLPRLYDNTITNVSITMNKKLTLENF